LRLSWSFTPFSLLPLLAAICMAALAVYAWRRRNRTARLFAFVPFSACIWAVCQTLQVLGADLETELFWAKIGYAGTVAAPLAWAVFAVAYTGRDRWLAPRRLALVSVIPLVTLLLVLTNSAHQLVWSDPVLDRSGPVPQLLLPPAAWFWVHAGYSYALNLLGAFLIVLAMLRAPGLYRQQAGALLLGASLPWLANLIYLTGLGRASLLDLTSIAYIASSLVFAWGIRRFQLLTLLPVARDTLMDASGDGLVVLDNHNRVVDINPAARHILNAPAGELIGQPAERLLKLQPGVLALDRSPALSHTEISTGADDQQRVYDLIITPLYDQRGSFTGWLIALRDITTHKAIESELRQQKQLFQNLVAVAHATAEGLSLEDTLQNALNVSAQLTGAERGSLFLLNASQVVTHSLLTYRGVTPAAKQDIVRRVMDRGLSGWVVRQREAVLIANTARDERWLASPGEGLPVASALGVPILSGSALVGVLTLSHSQPDQFKDEHLSLMQAAADQIALSLRNAQIFDEQRRMANEQAALYGVLRAVGEQLNPQSVARAAVEAIERLVDGSASWPGVSIALPDHEWKHWSHAAGGGELAGAVGQTFPMSEGAVGRAFTTGTLQSLPGLAVESGAANGAGHSQVAVPMRRGERVLGVLYLESSQPQAFGPADIGLAESLADAVALVLDNANLYAAIAGERSRLQALIESSRDGIFMVSMENRLVVVNAPVLSLLRLKGEPDDWLNRPIADVFRALRRHSPHTVRALLKEGRRIERGDEPANEGELELPPRTIHWLSLPVVDEHQPLGRLLVLRDITEERGVQKMREDLTHTMVHDLRNPLTNIRMALELLNQPAGSAGPTEIQQKEVVSIALNSTQRMLSLVNAILDVNRLESGQMPLVREPLSLHAAVTEVFRAQIPQVMEKNLQLENAVPASLPTPLVDGGLIRRVLQNLVGNAIKFTPDDGRIRVSAATEPGGSRVLVTVMDSGPGLPAEIRSSLFQKFVTGRHRERGSGLGLAYCKLAIEAHGGRIWVGGEPGWGAVFHFTLPLDDMGRAPDNGAVKLKVKAEDEELTDELEN
jgi:NtrC-family two-component system sensor histidine kinase KinB